EPDSLKRVVQDILTTQPYEIGCDECFAHLDTFAELWLAGKDTAEAMPLVHEHLMRCSNCREEFEALLAALKGLT
ncbi:MAG: hypothetical protein ACP5JG_19505, partial [Anaerolineae bacterium]